MLALRNDTGQSGHYTLITNEIRSKFISLLTYSSYSSIDCVSVLAFDIVSFVLVDFLFLFLCAFSNESLSTSTTNVNS